MFGSAFLQDFTCGEDTVKGRRTALCLYRKNLYILLQKITIKIQGFILILQKKNHRMVIFLKNVHFCLRLHAQFKVHIQVKDTGVGTIITLLLELCQKIKKIHYINVSDIKIKKYQYKSICIFNPNFTTLLNIIYI